MNNNSNNKNVHHSGNEYSLFVGDLPHDCNDESLQRLFQSKFKSVRRVQIIKNEDGSSRGFGFIRFEDQTDFQSALSQEMKYNGTTLRLDQAHRHNKGVRGRYSSFNSTVSNSNSHHNHHHFNSSNSNLHHHHHHNQSHHHHHPHAHHHPHQHRQQHGNLHNQSGGGNNKTLLSDHTPGSQHHSQPQGHNQVGGRGNSNSNHNTNNSTSNNNNSNPSQASPSGTGQQQQQATHHNQSQQQQQQQQPSSQHQNATLSSNVPFNSTNNQKNPSPQQSGPDNKQNSKQTNMSLSGDDSIKTPRAQSNMQNNNPLVSTQPTQSSQNQLTLSQVPTDPAVSQISGSSMSTTTTATTSMPLTSVNQTVAAVAAVAAMHNSQQNLNTTQQAIGPDLRSYVPQSMMDSHMMGAADPPSVVPPTSVYGHVYPYGPPPPFSYMPPPPQPNPVMPISAVPPAPPNQAQSTTGVGQQHTLTAAAVNANRFNPNAQQHHHSQVHHHPAHHQPQQPAHVTAGVDATGLGAMPGGLPQAPHQGPFYYYYPSPFYLDQSGGAAGAPNHLYHPSTFHPQFFAVPGPAYLPNAHGFNQHQPQPPSASQSDASLLSQQPQQPQQVPPPPTHQSIQQQQTKDR